MKSLELYYFGRIIKIKKSFTPLEIEIRTLTGLESD